jgi:succinate-acetate transporter protein
MAYFLLKTLTTALIVAGVSELARRHSMLAAALASLPLTSVLAFLWTYMDTRDSGKIIELSYGVFWLVFPSLLFFLLLPFLLKKGVGFYLSMALSCLAMSAGYGAFVFIKKVLS